MISRSFNFIFRYKDDVLSLSNFKFGDYVDHIYPIEIDKKVTTNTARSASFFDIHIETNSECLLRTKLYDKRDDLNFLIVNFHLLCRNIPAAPAFGIHCIYLSVDTVFQRECLHS